MQAFRDQLIVYQDELLRDRTAPDALLPRYRELQQFLRANRDLWDSLDVEAGQLIPEALLQRYRNVFQNHLNMVWREQVVSQFRATLAGRYPFDAASSEDASLADVEAFFHPESGVFAAFLDELDPFVEGDINQPATWTSDVIDLSARMRSMVQHVQGVTNTLFSEGQMQVAFALQFDQPQSTTKAAGPLRQVAIRLLGQTYTYNMGSLTWQSYQWPGPPGVQIQVTPQYGAAITASYAGDWALFRMVQAATVTRTAPSAYQLRLDAEQVRQGAYTVILNLRTESAGTSVFEPSFFTFTPPDRVVEPVQESPAPATEETTSAAPAMEQ